MLPKPSRFNLRRSEVAVATSEKPRTNSPKASGTWAAYDRAVANIVVTIDIIIFNVKCYKLAKTDLASPNSFGLSSF